MALFRKAAPVEDITPAVEEEQKNDEVIFEPVHKTVIGEGITFYGDFLTNEPLEVRGAIKGTVAAAKPVTIFRGGSFEGNAQVSGILINGAVNGNVICDGTAVFSSTGMMVGDLKTRQLQTDAGCAFDGNLRIDTGKPAPAPVETPQQNDAPIIDLSEEGDIPVTEEDLFS